MKIMLPLFLFFILDLQAQAQFTKVSLQASGLTCSMCSKAVKNALEKVAFVEKVQVDIKNQQYHVSFKDSKLTDFDVLRKAVEDAGFSVAAFKVAVILDTIKVTKDDHVLIGNQYFHFLNESGQPLHGPVTFTIVDKSFLPLKEFKKYSTLSKMTCVQTGYAAACCAGFFVLEEKRIYHVII